MSKHSTHVSYEGIFLCFSFKKYITPHASPYPQRGHSTPSMSCLRFQAASLKSGKDEEREVSVCTPVSSLLAADGKEAARRKQTFIKGWQNINRDAHGWAVMRGPRPQALPSCSCCLWVETSPPAHCCSVGKTRTCHSPPALDLPPGYFPGHG